MVKYGVGDTATIQDAVSIFAYEKEIFIIINPCNPPAETGGI